LRRFFAGVLCTSPAYVWVSNARQCTAVAWSDDHVGSQRGIPALHQALYREFKLCSAPCNSPSSTVTFHVIFASLVKLGRASHPHLFELDAQHVERIYGGLSASQLKFLESGLS